MTVVGSALQFSDAADNYLSNHATRDQTRATFQALGLDQLNADAAIRELDSWTPMRPGGLRVPPKVSQVGPADTCRHGGGLVSLVAFRAERQLDDIAQQYLCGFASKRWARTLVRRVLVQLWPAAMQNPAALSRAVMVALDMAVEQAGQPDPGVMALVGDEIRPERRTNKRLRLVHSSESTVPPSGDRKPPKLRLV